MPKDEEIVDTYSENIRLRDPETKRFVPKGTEVTPSGKEPEEVYVASKGKGIKTLAKQQTPRALAKLVEIMNNAGNREALKAAKLIIEYGYGKPYTMPVPQEERVDPLQDWSTAELEKLTVRLSRSLSDQTEDEEDLEDVVDLDTDDWSMEADENEESGTT